MKRFVKLIVIMGVFNYGSLCGMLTKVAAETEDEAILVAPPKAPAAKAVTKTVAKGKPTAVAVPKPAEVRVAAPKAAGAKAMAKVVARAAAKKTGKAAPKVNREHKPAAPKGKQAPKSMAAAAAAPAEAPANAKNAAGQAGKPAAREVKQTPKLALAVKQVLQKKVAAAGIDETPLCLAMIAGRYDDIHLLRYDDIHLLIERSNQETKDRALYLAAAKGHPGMVKLLLESEANILCRCPIERKFPIQTAAENGHLRTVQLLLESAGHCSERYANLPTESLDGGEIDIEEDIDIAQAQLSPSSYPLHLAAENGHVFVVNELLKHGARTDVMTKVDNQTPLHLAAKNGHVLVVEKLLDNGADFEAEATDKWDNTPLHYAIANGHTPIVRMFLKKFPIISDPSLMFSALETDNVVIFSLCFSACACKERFLNLRDNKGRTTLHHAVSKPYHFEIVKLLLEDEANHGSVIDYPDENPGNPDWEWGWTPLHQAAYDGELEIVRLLLEKGASPIPPLDKEGRTPLHLAAAQDKADVVQLLLSADIDLDAQANDGKTPLDMAAEGNCVDVVILLIEAGANPIKDEDGNVASDLCEFDDLRAILKEYEDAWY